MFCCCSFLEGIVYKEILINEKSYIFWLKKGERKRKNLYLDINNSNNDINKIKFLNIKWIVIFLCFSSMWFILELLSLFVLLLYVLGWYLYCFFVL